MAKVCLGWTAPHSVAQCSRAKNDAMEFKADSAYAALPNKHWGIGSAHDGSPQPTLPRLTTYQQADVGKETLTYLFNC